LHETNVRLLRVLVSPVRVVDTWRPLMESLQPLARSASRVVMVGPRNLGDVATQLQRRVEEVIKDLSNDANLAAAFVVAQADEKAYIPLTELVREMDRFDIAARKALDTDR